MRDRLIEGKLQVALRPAIGCGPLAQCGVGHGRVEADVVFEGAKVGDGSVLEEGGHAVAEAFFRVRRGLPDRLVHGAEQALHLGREAREVACQVLGYVGHRVRLLCRG